jgi:NAD+-dependent protein deacetylase sirtuin 7
MSAWHQDCLAVASLTRCHTKGAGISTSANIPDFRGPTGVWTMREKGKSVGGKNLHKAFPTFAHYCVTELVRRALLRFVVSTNMDALHLRSGLPVHLISEQHGNWYAT